MSTESRRRRHVCDGLELRNGTIPALVKWARASGYKREPAAGQCELFRLRKAGEPPLVFYEQGWGRISSAEPGRRLVAEFMATRKGTP